MRPQRYGRNASLMQIAAAVVGSSAAAQVIAPICTDEWQPAHQAGSHPEACATCGGVGTVQAEQHTYLTGGTPGVSETPHRLDVVGANQRRLIAFRAPEGVWIGGCLVSSPEDLVRLSEWLSGGGNGHA